VEHVLVCIALAMFLGWSIIALEMMKGFEQRLDEHEPQFADQDAGARAGTQVSRSRSRRAA